ncbi:MAG TPA: Gfo/Idh/MocA family oxidoreductase [Spirochaetia bacterium]|nr:Gfo/Idh/MocA family oxidoreductase [Spirochaetia bacterium]
MVKIALAGYGFMGQTHLDAYQQLPNVRVVAACTSGRVAQHRLPAEIPHFTSFAAMVEAGGFDAVDICLPTHLHRENAILALRRGFHVLCEKPLAANLEDCREMIRAAQTAGRALIVAHCLRYWPAYTAAKRLVDSMDYGKVLHIELSRFSPRPDWSAENWLSKVGLSGGAALDLHIHDADLLMHLFGAPKSVYSRGLFTANGGVHHITTLYGYPDFVAVGTGGWTASESFGFRMQARLFFENATVEIYPPGAAEVMVYPSSQEPYSLQFTKGDGYLPQLSAFVHAVESNDFSALVDAKEAARSVSLCLSEIESVRCEREVRISL